MNPPLKNRKARKFFADNNWHEIDLDETISRSRSWGRRFLSMVQSAYPDFFKELRFFGCRDLADIRALHDTLNDPIGIQFDLDLEYIIIICGLAHAEFGDWGRGEDEMIAAAFDCLCEELG